MTSFFTATPEFRPFVGHSPNLPPLSLSSDGSESVPVMMSDVESSLSLSSSSSAATSMHVDSEPLSLSAGSTSDHVGVAAKTDEVAKTAVSSTKSTFEEAWGEFLKDYEFDASPMAEGAMAKIFRVRERATGRYYALKINKDTSEPSFSAQEREISILGPWKNKRGFPTIFLNFRIGPRTVATMMTEKQPSLRDSYLRRGSLPMRWDDLCSLAYQLLLRLDDLDLAGVVHCNLTPDHVVYDSQTGEVSLLSFGKAHTADQLKAVKAPLQSCAYRAPESIQLSKNRNLAIDVWSVGCILAEMILGKPLFSDRDDNHASEQLKCVKKIFEQEKMGDKFIDLLSKKLLTQLASTYPLVDPQQRRNLTDLVKRLLRYDPLLRIQPCDALEHAFFSQNLFFEVHAAPDIFGRRYILFLMHAPAKASKSLAQVNFNDSSTASRMMPRAKGDMYTALLVPEEDGDPIETTLKIPPRAILHIRGTKIHVQSLFQEEESSSATPMHVDGKDEKKAGKKKK